MKQKCPAKTAHIPCIVRDANSAILAEDDSLAETMQRAALHPLDQFRAFLALREKGQGDEEITSAFFVSPRAVKQRPNLAVQWLLPCSSPTHMARLSWNKEPYQFRRMLTETAVRASEQAIGGYFVSFGINSLHEKGNS